MATKWSTMYKAPKEGRDVKHGREMGKLKGEGLWETEVRLSIENSSTVHICCEPC